MKKTDARVRYTIKALKEALLSLLAAKPINKITVKEVCEKAELNRATFYTHFDDCFDLLESIEADLLGDFEKSLRYVDSLEIPSLVAAIYDMIEQNEEVCRVLVFGNKNAAVIRKMIERARQQSIQSWKKELKKATSDELEMLFTHLSNGLMSVIVDGYARYPKETVIRFVNRTVKCSLDAFR